MSADTLYLTDEEWVAAGYPHPGPDANYRVVAARAIGPLTLWVEHADGVKGHVRFEPGHLRGVFEPLRDPEFFAQAGVDGIAVTWPGEIDLAPDNMHRHLYAFGEWVLE